MIALLIAGANLLSIVVAQADGAFADKKELAAKGERQCRIAQFTSPYLDAEHRAAEAKAGVPFYMQTMSYLKFRVLKSGAIMVAMSEDIYPGSTFYFLIDGKRYSGPAKYYLQLDARALAALKQDKLFDFTYTNWPYRNEINRKDIFTGFSRAYDDCLAFLSGRGGDARAAAAPLEPKPTARPSR
jgi:hypothetical protein